MRLAALPRPKRRGRRGPCRGVSPPIHTLMRAEDRQLLSPPPIPGITGLCQDGAGSGAGAGAGAGALFGAALRLGAARFAVFFVVFFLADIFEVFFFLRAGAAFFLLAFLFAFFAIIVLPFLAASGISRRSRGDRARKPYFGSE